MRELLKEALDYILELRQRYINEGRRSDEISAINDLISRIDDVPDPDIELVSDAEYGFVARYKSLTADGKTKDEAMRELARVILAAFDLEVVSEVEDLKERGSLVDFAEENCASLGDIY